MAYTTTEEVVAVTETNLAATAVMAGEEVVSICIYTYMYMYMYFLQSEVYAYMHVYMYIYISFTI
jgi:hypothetical protein